MAVIGLDIDGVLTDIHKFQLEKGEKFLKEKFQRDVVNRDAQDIDEIFECNEKESRAFWTKYLMKYSISEKARDGAGAFTKALHEKGDKIVIITSRVYTESDSVLGKTMRFIVEEWLKQNNIEYDEIVYCDEDKKEAIKLNNITVMVEDSPKNIEELSKITNVVVMDNPYNKDISGHNINRIFGFDQDALKTMDKIRNIYDSLMVDEIKPLSGKPSIDKPWMRYYTYGQVSGRIPNVKIYDYMYLNNRWNRQGEAINYFDRSISFGKLFNDIEVCAKALKANGVEKGDIVTICMPNTPEVLVTFYALNRIGAIANMVHPLSKKNAIKDFVNETDSKMLFMFDDSYKEVKEIIKDTNISKAVVISAKDSMPMPLSQIYGIKQKRECSFYKEKLDDVYVTWKEFMKDAKNYKGDGVLDTEYEPNTPAVILHTGGTTGKSKGAVLSNDNFNGMVHQYGIAADFTKGDKMVAVMPVFHGFGLCNSMHMPMCLRASTILIPQFNNKTFPRLVEKHKPEHIMGVPTLWEAVTSNKKFDGMDLSFFKYVVSGGDTMKDDFEQRVNKFLEDHNSTSKITKGYGLTEAVASATFTFENCNKIGSIGIPLVSSTVKIIEYDTEKQDEDGINTKEELGYNEQGEICISGPTVMMEYYNNPEETSKDIRLHDDGKLWLHTGDIGYIKEDGTLYFTDRSKRMIIVSGVNVYPTEIEQVITDNEKVDACAVVSMPHKYKQHVPKAYIVPNKDKNLDESDIVDLINDCNEKIPNNYYRPYQFEFVDALPKTPLGKVDFLKLEKDAKKDADMTYRKVSTDSMDLEIHNKNVKVLKYNHSKGRGK